jgi:hypothetical protein
LPSPAIIGFVYAPSFRRQDPQWPQLKRSWAPPLEGPIYKPQLDVGDPEFDSRRSKPPPLTGGFRSRRPSHRKARPFHGALVIAASSAVSFLFFFLRFSISSLYISSAQYLGCPHLHRHCGVAWEATHDQTVADPAPGSDQTATGHSSVASDVMQRRAAIGYGVLIPPIRPTRHGCAKGHSSSDCWAQQRLPRFHRCCFWGQGAGDAWMGGGGSRRTRGLGRSG